MKLGLSSQNLQSSAIDGRGGRNELWPCSDVVPPSWHLFEPFTGDLVFLGAQWMLRILALSSWHDAQLSAEAQASAGHSAPPAAVFVAPASQEALISS